MPANTSDRINAFDVRVHSARTVQQQTINDWFRARFNAAYDLLPSAAFTALGRSQQAIVLNQVRGLINFNDAFDADGSHRRGVIILDTLYPDPRWHWRIVRLANHHMKMQLWHDSEDAPEDSV